MAACPSCSTDNAPGARWCALCHTYMLDPRVGRLASPGARLGAYVLDLIVPLVGFFLILSVGGASLAAAQDATLGIGVVLLLMLGYALWALTLFARGTTPGKWLLGMRVVKEDGRNAGFGTMLIREWVGKWISGLLLSLGYFWILLDRDNQGWHDKLLRTYVVVRPRGDQQTRGEPAG